MQTNLTIGCNKDLTTTETPFKELKMGIDTKLLTELNKAYKELKPKLEQNSKSTNSLQHDSGAEVFKRPSIR